MGSKDLVLWLQFKADGNDGIEFFYGKSLRAPTEFEKILIAILPDITVDLKINPLVAMMDGLAEVIGMLAIPEKFFDPDHPEFNPIVGMVFDYGRHLNPGSAVIRGQLSYISVSDPKKYSPLRMEFALYCGFWNGLVDQVKGIPTLVSWGTQMITDGATRAEFEKGWDRMKAQGFWNTMWDGIKKAHTAGNPCIISAQVGADFSNLLTIVFAFTKAGSLGKIAQIMEAVDPVTYLVKSLQLILEGFNAGSKYFYNLGKGIVYTAISNGELIFKVAKKAGKELTDLDWSLVKTLALQAPDGKIYTVTILSDPTDPINQSIRNIKEIIKDEQGKIIKDKTGNGLAVTDEGSLAIVKDVEGTISKLDLLASSYPNLGKKIRELHNDLQEAFIKDFDGNVEVLTKFEGNEGWVDGWNSFKKVGLDDLAKSQIQLQKFEEIVKNNNLKLDTKGLEDVLRLPKTKGLSWDNPEWILDAIKRASDNNLDGLTIGHRKFPEPKDGSYSFVLEQAKEYQGKPKFDDDILLSGSGDANLSFNYNGVSFDNIIDGRLIDNKFGHASSVFKETDDLYSEIQGLEDFIEQSGKVTIINQKRVNSIIAQANRQLEAVAGTGIVIEWHISTDLGARGILQVFQEQGITGIIVKHINQ